MKQEVISQIELNKSVASFLKENNYEADRVIAIFNESAMYYDCFENIDSKFANLLAEYSEKHNIDYTELLEQLEYFFMYPKEDLTDDVELFINDEHTLFIYVVLDHDTREPLNSYAMSDSTYKQLMK